MKLVRFDTPTGAVPGVVRDGEVVGLAELARRFPSVRSIVAGGQSALDEVAEFVSRAPATSSLESARLLAPIERPGKYLAIGLNYAAHVAESEKAGIAQPKHQLWFNKQTTCISGPFEDIDPGVTERLDYEAELGVVIGATARYVAEQDASKHVFGYFVANDVTARDWQFHTPTFTIGKSFDTHGPIGPWIVTADEVPDPHALMLRCYVNRELRQQCSTGQMIHDIWKQVHYLSTAFTLESGDLLATGTPSGVGVSREPATFLQPGDVVRCEVEGIGAIENKVVRSSAVHLLRS